MGQTQGRQLDSIDDALERLCRAPRGDPAKWPASRITASNFKQIASLLEHASQSEMPSELDMDELRIQRSSEWYKLPRTYTVLRNIQRLDCMNEFIAEEYTDLRLPYSDHTLPPFIRGPFRQVFLEHQQYVLTHASDLETSGKQHVNFPDNAELYFVRVRDLGSGSFGAVDVVLSKLGVREYARKKVTRGQTSVARKRENAIFREIALLKELEPHRHVVRLLSSYADPYSVAYLMEPTAECNLEDLLDRFSDNQSLLQQCQTSFRYFYGCLASAVQYLHIHGITHSDISCKNILVKDMRIVVSDLGAALNIRNTARNSALGTPWYEAPERRLAKQRHPAMDMWSIGVVFLEMTTVLLGRSVGSLERHIERKSRERHTGHSLSANLPAVQEWTQTLISDRTPANNAPLAWIQTLMKKKPEQRPSAEILMQTILDSPSYNTFCCHDCKPDFKATAATLNEVSQGGRTVSRHRVSDMIATLLEEDDDDERVPVMTASQETRIMTWQTDMMHAQFPGAFPEALDEPVESVIEEQQEVPSLMTPKPSARFDIHRYKAEKNWAIEESDYSDEDNGSEDENESNGPKLAFNTHFEVTQDSSDSESCNSSSGSASDCDNGYANLAELTDKSMRRRKKRNVSHLRDVKSLLPTVEELKEEENTDTAVILAAELASVAVEQPQDISQSSWQLAELSVNNVSQVEDVGAKHLEEQSVRSEPQGEHAIIEPSTTSLRFDEDFELARRPDQEAKLVAGLPPPEDVATFTDAEETEKGREQLEDAQFSDRESEVHASVLAPPPLLWDRSTVAEDEGIHTTPSPQATIAPSVNLLSTHNLRKQQKESAKAGENLRLPKLINPTIYMEQAWDAATSVASSEMSVASKNRLLNSLPMLKWQDRHGRLLESCCKKGNPAAVRVLLQEAKINPGTKTKPRKAPLSICVRGCSLRHNKCVLYLLDAGADIDMVHSRDGTTPLHWAIENPVFKGYENLIRDLIFAGADPNKADFGGNYPIQKVFDSDATKPLEDHRRTALALILKSQCKEGVNLKVTMPGSGHSLLHLAVQRRSAIAIGLLVSKGADVNVRDTSDTTPLILAANQWHGELIETQQEMLGQLLAAKDLDVNFRGGPSKATALHYAAKAGSVMAVEALLDRGADVILHCKDNRTALVWALREMASKKHTDVIKTLVLATEQNWHLDAGKSVLQQALVAPGLLVEIIDSGYPIDEPMGDGRSLLIAAIEADRVAAVETLLNLGASTATTSSDGPVNALDHATKVGSKEVIGFLKDALRD